MQHHDLSEPSKNCGRNGSHSAWWTGWRYHHRRVYKPSLLAIKELQSEIWRKAFEAVHKCFGLSVTLFVRHGNAGVRGLSPKHVQACKIHAQSKDFRSQRHIVVETSGLGALRLFAKHTNAAISGKADIRRVDWLVRHPKCFKTPKRWRTCGRWVWHRLWCSKMFLLWGYFWKRIFRTLKQD